MTEILDLRAPKLKVRFDKGVTVKPIFYYLDDSNAVVDLTDYTAIMEIYLLYTDAVPEITLTTENDGLDLVQGTARIKSGTTLIDGSVLQDDLLVPNAWGVKLNLTADVTADLEWTTAVFHLNLIEPLGDIIPFMKGILLPSDPEPIP